MKKPPVRMSGRRVVELVFSRCQNEAAVPPDRPRQVISCSCGIDGHRAASRRAGRSYRDCRTRMADAAGAQPKDRVGIGGKEVKETAGMGVEDTAGVWGRLRLAPSAVCALKSHT